MIIPPVAPLPNLGAGERHTDGAKQRRQARKKGKARHDQRRSLTETLPSAGYDAAGYDDSSDLGHVTDELA